MFYEYWCVSSETMHECVSASMQISHIKKAKTWFWDIQRFAKLKEKYIKYWNSLDNCSKIVFLRILYYFYEAVVDSQLAGSGLFDGLKIGNYYVRRIVSLGSFINFDDKDFIMRSTGRRNENQHIRYFKSSFQGSLVVKDSGSKILYESLRWLRYLL